VPAGEDAASDKEKAVARGVPAGEDAAGGKGKAVANGTCSSAPAADVEMANLNVDSNRETIAEPAEEEMDDEEVQPEEIEWWPLQLQFPTANEAPGSSSGLTTKNTTFIPTSTQY
jgi:hypothetical protein